jgi:hypothetical protein
MQCHLAYKLYYDQKFVEDRLFKFSNYLTVKFEVSKKPAVGWKFSNKVKND